MFSLDSRLENDTLFIANLQLSRLLLMNDSNFMWLILVPQKENLTELTDLDFAEQTQLLKEINLAAEILKKNFPCDKLNIATLGNVVSQLHIHVIARRKDDAAFPKPVWGNSVFKLYEKERAEELVKKIRSLID